MSRNISFKVFYKKRKTVSSFEPVRKQQFILTPLCKLYYLLVILDQMETLGI
jgi:hypothetical protein